MHRSDYGLGPGIAGWPIRVAFLRAKAAFGGGTTYEEAFKNTLSAACLPHHQASGQQRRRQVSVPYRNENTRLGLLVHNLARDRISALSRSLLSPVMGCLPSASMGTIMAGGNLPHGYSYRPRSFVEQQPDTGETYIRFSKSKAESLTQPCL